MKRPRFSHYENENVYEIDLESYAEFAENKIVELEKENEQLKDKQLSENYIDMLWTIQRHLNNKGYEVASKILTDIIKKLS